MLDSAPTPAHPPRGYPSRDSRVLDADPEAGGFGPPRRRGTEAAVPAWTMMVKETGMKKRVAWRSGGCRAVTREDTHGAGTLRSPPSPSGAPTSAPPAPVVPIEGVVGHDDPRETMPNPWLAQLRATCSRSILSPLDCASSWGRVDAENGDLLIGVERLGLLADIAPILRQGVSQRERTSCMGTS